MNIALLSNTYWPFTGGVPVAVDTLANELMATGHRVIIITFADADGRDDPDYVYRISFVNFPGLLNSGLKISCRNQWLWNLFWLLDTSLGGRVAVSAREQIRDVIDKESIDVIHVNQPFGLGTQALRLAREEGIPCVYTFHTQYEHYLKGILVENPLISSIISHHSYRFANKSDYVIAPSEAIKELLIRHRVTSPIKVIPTGVRVHTDTGGQAVRKTLGINNNTKVFISVSRLSAAKNVDKIIHAFSSIHSIKPDTHLLVVGDGKQRKSLEKKAGKLGIADAITFTGNIPRKELWGYYAASDIFLFASRYESQGIVLTEAMAFGLPVICLDIRAARETLEGTGAFLVDTVDEMIEKGIQLLEDKSLMSEISRRSRQRAKAFDPQSLARSVFNIYESLSRHPVGIPYFQHSPVQSWEA